MIETFSDVEALEIGLNLEREGVAFYSQAAAGAKNPQTAALYRKIAAEEKNHYAKFAKEREKLLPDSYLDSAEISSYLQRLNKMGIFAANGEMLKQLAEITTELQVVALAIKAEKESLLFYYEAATNSKNESGRQLFTWLIGEEKRHLQTFGEMFAKLTKQEG